ncbi:MAG: CRISPR-associated endonuclease Cas3'', partial [Chloroflexi bacterium]|nr:CRISPR-associated endonuclease Cas3'' [Chloroflexota bacterium]
MDAYELVRPWAKLSRLKDGAVAYHPLICHMADVAAVTRALWERAIAEGARRSIAESCGLAEEDGGRWLAFWAGLHDLGKACPAFQHQDAAGDVIREHLRAVGLARPGVPVPSKDAPHGVVSAKVLVTLLVAELGVAREVATRVATAVGGHHGVLPQSKPVLDLSPYAVGDGPWDAVRRALVRRLAHLVGLPDARPQRLDNAAAMFLAGLTSVADWIASIKEQFQYAIADASLPPPDLSAYGALAEERAVAALDRLGWTGWSPATDVRPFTALFGVASPYPMQQATIDLASLLDGPSLVIIEAPMGEGKTEAAMYLADTWGIERGQRGCYFALPTQATSNQMYDRVREFLRQRYPGQVVNAQLVHGHAALAAEIEVLAEGAHQAIEVSNIHGDAGGSALASVAAAEWFTRRKRGLLAPFGVGTVDQALLAALQTRHVFV